jgi:hypothetical protein
MVKFALGDDGLALAANGESAESAPRSMVPTIALLARKSTAQPLSPDEEHVAAQLVEFSRLLISLRTFFRK